MYHGSPAVLVEVAEKDVSRTTLNLNTARLTSPNGDSPELHPRILFGSTISEILLSTTQASLPFSECGVVFGYINLETVCTATGAMIATTAPDHDPLTTLPDPIQWLTQPNDVQLLTYDQMDSHQAAQLRSWMPQACQQGWAVPITIENRLIGGIIIPVREPDHWTDAQFNALRHLTAQCALGMSNSNCSQSTLDKLPSADAAAQEELVSSRNRFNLALENSINAILFLTEMGLIEQYNAAFAQIMGCGPADFLDQPIWEIARDEDMAELHQAVRAVRERGRQHRVTIQLNTQQPQSVEVAFTPIVERDKHVGFVCTMQDVTERVKVEAQLRSQLIHEQEVNHMRSQFVSMASHQFRTPLAIIQAAAESFVEYHDKMDHHKRVQRLERIREQVERMTLLLDNVLTLSDLTSHRKLFNPTVIDLAKWLPNFLKSYTSQNPGSVIDYQPHLDDDAAIWADEEVLRRIFLQLLTNAIKFSPPDDPIEVSMISTPTKVVITVTDKGVGIPNEDIERVFESFFRSTNALPLPGNGLGLAILKEDMRLLGGEVTLKSELGQGTTVTSTFTRSTAL